MPCQNGSWIFYPNMAFTIHHFQNMAWTSGEAYTVTVDGTEDQTFTVDSMVISAGGSVDTMGGGPMDGQDMNGDMGGGPQGDMSQNGDMPQMGQGGPAQGGGNMQPPQDAKTN